MTLSQDAIVKDLTRALRILLELDPDGYAGQNAFSLREYPWTDFLPTTRAEFPRNGYVKVAGAQAVLTPAGWLAAHQLNGAFDETAFRENATTLRAALEQLVTNGGRQNQARGDVSVLAREIELSENWVWNALRSQLLDAIFPGRNHTIEIVALRYVCVLNTFGSPEV